MQSPEVFRSGGSQARADEPNVQFPAGIYHRASCTVLRASGSANPSPRARVHPLPYTF